MPLEELETLTDRYRAACLRDPATALPNLQVLRREAVSALEATVYNPVLCLILSGSKETHIGTQSVSLRRGDALLVSHDLPVTSKITQASPGNPYLALILSLDIGTVRALYEQVGEFAVEMPDARSMTASVAQAEWTDPLARYLRLMDNPLEAQVLGPAVLRELHFRLLMSPMGGMLRNLLSVDSHASRIARAIGQIRRSFRQPLVVADLARSVGMSPSSFHEHFRDVTGTTPLQYQKDLRLIEAQTLLRSGGQSVSVTGHAVGYESPTHFSRDYARKFGCSPRHHLAQAS
ncbi:AraC family transcriptional regulator [Rhodobacter sp. NTK016B]|uniref:AraC family transcriptional regulator n=1 Tax=Rhodobacter sp. NTK016B TaxID=2759676 RepID=UPI001A8E0422|nr:AraC family transcriptional regulator [Rhodobacter sp. NTK016B]MBN8294793.1 AraC family transcriptional regulator [Rhodobacter sp. NTK016B]